MIPTQIAIALDAELLSRTPPEVVELLRRLLEENASLHETVKKLLARIEELEAKLNQNSSNSNKPPSTDSPFIKKPAPPKKGKKTRKRKGTRQQCMRPTKLVELYPEACSCGCQTIADAEPYYIHQVIELPEIQVDVSHIFLYRGRCHGCGKMVKAHIPHELRTGFGPRLSAVVAELAGNHGDSRRGVRDFLFSVLGIPISQGGVQNILDRVSQSLAPHYESIGEVVHSSPVNHIDETSWKQKKTLKWLWVMCNSVAAFFMVHSKRSRRAFQDLIKKWQGFLVSDGYNVYQSWAHGRQTCLAHLIRRAKGLAQRNNPTLSGPGAWILKELQLLCCMAKEPPSVGQWNMFYARMHRLIGLYQDRKDEVGRLVRHLREEMDCLWLFLQEKGVDPTNNLAERTLRFAVLWRKRSFGTRVDKGDHFVERILSLRQTCRLQKKRTFPILVEAMTAFLQGTKPDLKWIKDLVQTTP